MKFVGFTLLSLLSVEAACDSKYPTPTPTGTPAATTEAPTTPPTPTETPATTEAPSSSSSGHSNFARFFDQDRFQTVFPDAIELYGFDGLVNAANKYSEFANTGDDDSDKRELAAFLAQTAHESDSFKAAQEYGWEEYSVSQYCNATTFPCAAGQRYHGRGPIQISWNYNYATAGEALGIDLLDNPNIVAEDHVVTWMTALWYWMTPQGDGRVIHDVVVGENGFAQSTDIINGGLECGPDAPNKANEQQRIEYFTKMCEALDVEPLGLTSCNA